MADATFPTSWNEAFKSAAANLIWILPLVAVERGFEGHYYQSGAAVAAWIVDAGFAIHANVFAGRRGMAWLAISFGAVLLGIGIFLLGASTGKKDETDAGKLPSIASVDVPHSPAPQTSQPPAIANAEFASLGMAPRSDNEIVLNGQYLREVEPLTLTVDFRPFIVAVMVFSPAVQRSKLETLTNVVKKGTFQTSIAAAPNKSSPWLWAGGRLKGKDAELTTDLYGVRVTISDQSGKKQRFYYVLARFGSVNGGYVPMHPNHLDFMKNWEAEDASASN